MIIQQVFQRLQRLNLCLSHQMIVTQVKLLGEDFDNQVLKWRNASAMTLEDQREVYTNLTLLFDLKILCRSKRNS